MDEFNDFPLALREVHTVYIYGIRPYFTTQDFILPAREGLTPPLPRGRPGPAEPGLRPWELAPRRECIQPADGNRNDLDHAQESADD